MSFSQNGKAMNGSRSGEFSNRNYLNSYNNNNNNNNNNNGTKYSPRRNRMQNREKETLRGTFEIISISEGGQQIVAIETGWKNDMKKLSDGLVGYADFSKTGIDDMERDNVYGCRVEGAWRRCRMVSRHGPGGFVVDLIDYGGRVTVTRDDLLVLSQLYKDWSIKSVDIIFAGYSVDCGLDQGKMKELESMLVKQSFQIGYTHERTGPSLRDRVFVTEMKQQDRGENVLSKLIEKGFLTKSMQQQQTQQSERPSSQQSFQGRSTQQERIPLKTQRPITKSGLGPRLDSRSRSHFEGGSQSYTPTSPRQPSVDHHYQSPVENGWGSVEPCQDDTGADHWASPQSEGKKAFEWTMDQRENEDPQTQWNASKKWTSTDWDCEPPQNISSESVAQRSFQQQQDEPQFNNDSDGWSNVDVSSPRQSTSLGQPLQRTPERRAELSKEDVFSSASDWTESTNQPSPKEKDLSRGVENLHLTGGAASSTGECARCVQLENKVNTLESCLYGAALQKVVSTRLTNLSMELRQVKINLAQLRLDPLAEGNEGALAFYRREGRIRVKEVEELLLTASAETLASFGMNGWSQFVGIIWKPMMDLQYLDEKSLCVYRGTVIRRVALEEDAAEVGPSPLNRSTVVLERAIEIPRMFPVLQSLAPNRAQGRVNCVFFSEDNSKVYIQLECPQSTEQDLEQFGKDAITALTDLGIIDK